MATTYEIIQALSQASANAYDGALTEDGEALKARLKREVEIYRLTSCLQLIYAIFSK